MHLLVVNPRRQPAVLTRAGIGSATLLLGSGVVLVGDAVEVDGFGYRVVELA